MSEEEKQKKMVTFVNENESAIKKFGLLKEYEDRYLMVTCLMC